MTTAQTNADTSQEPGLALPEVLTDGGPLPALVVFDLDYTIWPFNADIHIADPITPAPGSDNSAVVDSSGDRWGLYADVEQILHALSGLGIRLGVASRDTRPDLCRDLLTLLHVHSPGQRSSMAGGDERPRSAIDLFDAGLEIYWDYKTQHMRALSQRTGIPYESILFFDDNPLNQDTEGLGITMQLVTRRFGANWLELDRGIREWRRRNYDQVSICVKIKQR